MNIITLDYETYYSDAYSLSRMSTQEYITHDEFEVIGVGVKHLTVDEPTWHTGDDVNAAMAVIRAAQDNTVLVAHNAMFDAAIASWHYGVRPAFVVDTISMARVLGLQSTVGGSLAKLAEQMREHGIIVPRKGDEVVNAKGKHLRDFTPAQLHAYGEYCRDDCRIAEALFLTLRELMPLEELVWQSAVLKMYTEPMLRVNGDTVAAELQRVRERREASKDRLARALGFEDTSVLLSIINSNPKFADALRLFGAEVPMKMSEKTKKMTPALGIKDEGLVALLDHPVTEVRELVMARMGLKSSIEESRCEAMAWQAEFERFPVPYRVSGARTHRLGGGEGSDEDGAERAMQRGKVNMQNLPSGRVEGQSKALRESVEAPERYTLVSADSSQVECLWGEGVVLTEYNGWIKIRNVSTSERIWDGVEWVNHGGPIYKGEKNVITYSGITATPDHVVYLTGGGRTTLAAARDGAKTILACDNAGAGIRQVDCAVHTTTHTGQWESESPMHMHLRHDSLGTSDRPKRAKIDCVLTMREMEQEEVCSHTGDTRQTTAGTLQFNSGAGEGEQTLVEDVCRGGNSYDSGGVRQLYVDELPDGRLHWSGSGQDTDQRALRTREHTPSHTPAERPDACCERLGDAQRRDVVSKGVCRQILSTSPSHISDALVETGDVQRTNHCGGASSDGAQSCNECDVQRGDTTSSYIRQEVLSASELASGMALVESRENTTTVCEQCWPTTQEERTGVWDIVNAGPRHRFAYNGRIVSNCRVIDYMANDVVGIADHKAGVCPYSSLVVQLYGEGTPDQIKRDAKAGMEPWAQRRQISKSARLSLQFGSGAEGFRLYCKASGVTITIDEAEFYKSGFRNNKPALVALWRKCDRVLEALLARKQGHFGGPDGKLFFFDGARTVLGQAIPGIKMPDGIWLNFPNLALVEGKYGPTYRTTEMKGRKPNYVYLHGAKVAQQLTQALAFGVMKWYATQTKHKIVLNSHDEHVLCVPTNEADTVATELESLMKTAPPWAPGLPLDCEVHVGSNYGVLK